MSSVGAASHFRARNTNPVKWPCSWAYSGQPMLLETAPRAWRCLDAGLMMELAISFIPRLDQYDISPPYWMPIHRIRSISRILPVCLWSMGTNLVYPPSSSDSRPDTVVWEHRTCANDLKTCYIHHIFRHLCWRYRLARPASPVCEATLKYSPRDR